MNSTSTISHFLFDLDGTLSDPLQGFVLSVNYALEAEGYSSVDASELMRHVGPPLEGTLAELTGSSDENLIGNLVSKYRERYNESGYLQNTLYPGLEHLLHKLHADGVRLGVCTSKPEGTARRILENFNLDHYFEFISGGDVGVVKAQQLAELLEKNMIDEHALMIGDRVFDIAAAKKNKLRSMAVTWGYGSQQEIALASPDYVVSDWREILLMAEALGDKVKSA